MRRRRIGADVASGERTPTMGPEEEKGEITTFNIDLGRLT